MIQKHLQDIKETRDNEKFSDYEKCSECYEAPEDFASLPTGSKWSNQPVTDTEDELFLIIDHHNDNDSGVFITKEQQFFHDMDIDLPKDLSSTPKRKLRGSRDFESLKSHAIKTLNPPEDFTRASFKFELVHKEIRSKMNGMKEIIEQEHSFFRKIDKYTLDDFDDQRNFLETNFDYVANEFCDNNETIIV